MIISPQTTSGDKMNAIMLFCAVDSNPPPKYYWTKGNSREVATISFKSSFKQLQAFPIMLSKSRKKQLFQSSNVIHVCDAGYQ